MANNLGKWALVDIETSGINSEEDSIIDVGYLQFEGLELVKKYSSLVKFPMTALHHDNYSKFIEKLTGITPRMLKDAPRWEEVLHDVRELHGNHLIAHNANFEESFLSQWLQFGLHTETESDEELTETTYEDSLHYLALLHPEQETLKLDEFIQMYGIRDSEVHRGFEDSLDLLKVMIASTLRIKKDRLFSKKMTEILFNYHLDDWWFKSFFELSPSELERISEQIDFDAKNSIEHFYAQKKQQINDTIDVNDNAAERNISFNKENLTDILKNEEEIKEILPHYKFRKQQLDLSIRTGQALKNNTHAIIQAPTGTGKTLGYLIPAAMFALEEKEPVLISTGTKALQDQAMNKDIPLLKKILGKNADKLKVKRLIGSNNHLCESLFRGDSEDNSLLMSGMSFEDRFTYAYYEAVFWLNANGNTQPRLRNNLPFVFKKKISLFAEKDKEWAVDFRSCAGKSCPYKNDCSYINGLREAKDADLIIGNHALMYSWPKSIPRPLNIIVDEAHKIEHETTNACSIEVSKSDLEKIQNSLKTMQGVGSLFYLLAQEEKNSGDSTSVINDLRDSFTHYSSMLQDQIGPVVDHSEKYFKKMPRYTSLYWNELPLEKNILSRDFSGKKIIQHLESIFNILSLTVDKLLPHVSRFEMKTFNDDAKTKAWTRFETFYQLVNETKETLDQVFDFSESIETNKFEYTKSFKYHEEFGFYFKSAPVNVGRFIHDFLLEPTQSVIFTSATLGNAHGNIGSKGIEWVTGYLYLKKEKRFQTGLYLPSVFDYKNKTKVYLCDDTPVLWSDDFVEETLNKVSKVTKEIGGRSLFLFSAKKRFEKAREILLEKFEGTIPVFIQGMGNNIVDEFKKAENGILLGMESLGEGIDIPGESLQFVFIDKIPDLRMDLVINDRRDFFEKNIGNEFSDYYLSSRTRALHQKLGRLLRTDSDYGGVIITDSRVKKWKGKTLETINRLMEPYDIHRKSLDEACEGVLKFIKQGHH